jgi:hypothetical protein
MTRSLSAVGSGKRLGHRRGENDPAKDDDKSNLTCSDLKVAGDHHAPIHYSMM